MTTTIVKKIGTIIVKNPMDGTTREFKVIAEKAEYYVCLIDMKSTLVAKTFVVKYSKFLFPGNPTSKCSKVLIQKVPRFCSVNK